MGGKKEDGSVKFFFQLLLSLGVLHFLLWFTSFRSSIFLALHRALLLASFCLNDDCMGSVSAFGNRRTKVRSFENATC